ncbi:Crp/Fnr family transcriptional regulator [Spirosoma endbachense]|nr:Crp/Fnr family transcriptional regulator [Spirosoma endbachense]
MDTNRLLTELQARHDFPAGQFPQFLALFDPLYIQKNQIVFLAGDIVSYAYFIVKGCLRQYYVNAEGVENTIYFAEEGGWTGEMSSFIHRVPTTMNLQALEDSQALVLTRTNWELATRTFPDYALYQIKNRARNITRLKEQIGHAQTDTPDQKYRRLLTEKPHLLQRLAQYQIANYLGVTPETYSRIRKRNTPL